MNPAAKLSPAQAEALRNLVAGGGKIVTTGAWSSNKGTQQGYGHVRTPQGQVEIWDRQLEALERRGIVKLVKHESERSVGLRFKSRPAPQERSWTRWWEVALTPDQILALTSH